MAFPTASRERELKHRRSIDVSVFARGHGLWEVDATLMDVRTRDVPLATGIRPAGAPIHSMLLRLVVNEQFDILEAGAQTLAMPYPDHCDDYGDAYEALVGLNLLKGFRQGVRARLGGVKGCTHLTELTQALPTAVIQAFAGEVIDTRGVAEDSEQPFQIDRCHALRADGPVVQIHYPRWYRAPSDKAPTSVVPVTTDH